MEPTCDQLTDHYPTYAVVDKKNKKKKSIDSEKRDSFDLYAVVDKKKKKSMPKCQGEDKNTDITALYAVVNKKEKNIVPLVERNASKNIPGSVVEDKAEFTNCPPEYPKYKPSVNSEEACKQWKMPQFIHLRYIITIIVMITLILTFIITTAVGFIKVSTLESKILLISNSNACASLEPESRTPTTEDTELSIPTVISLFEGTRFSHLQNFFSRKKILLGFLMDCLEKRQDNFSQCINQTIRIYGKNMLLPAVSCNELYNVVPNNSGYYWVTSSDGSIIEVYCEMTKSCGNITGGLTRIVSINSTIRSQYCTGDIDFHNIDGCFKMSPERGCSGIILPVPNLSYSNICGTLEGRHFGTVDGFRNRSTSVTINDDYVDGISLTYGNTSHRTHLWTFSASNQNCSINVPEYVGLHHSCLETYDYCRSHNCEMTFQRTFHNSHMTDIEARFCQDEHRDVNSEGILLTNMDLFMN